MLLLKQQITLKWSARRRASDFCKEKRLFLRPVDRYATLLKRPQVLNRTFHDARDHFSFRKKALSTRRIDFFGQRTFCVRVVFCRHLSFQLHSNIAVKSDDFSRPFFLYFYCKCAPSVRYDGFRYNLQFYGKK